jgi:hypothetical protein
MTRSTAPELIGAEVLALQARAERFDRTPGPADLLTEVLLEVVEHFQRGSVEVLPGRQTGGAGLDAKRQPSRQALGVREPHRSGSLLADT